MLRWAAMLMVIAALAVLGYSGLGGVFADLAQMLLFIALGVVAVLATLQLSRRRA